LPLPFGPTRATWSPRSRRSDVAEEDAPATPTSRGRGRGRRGHRPAARSRTEPARPALGAPRNRLVLLLGEPADLRGFACACFALTSCGGSATKRSGARCRRPRGRRSSARGPRCAFSSRQRCQAREVGGAPGLSRSRSSPPPKPAVMRDDDAGGVEGRARARATHALTSRWFVGSSSRIGRGLASARASGRA
jgi:hypothetical protein